MYFENLEHVSSNSLKPDQITVFIDPETFKDAENGLVIEEIDTITIDLPRLMEPGFAEKYEETLDTGQKASSGVYLLNMLIDVFTGLTL